MHMSPDHRYIDRGTFAPSCSQAVRRTALGRWYSAPRAPMDSCARATQVLCRRCLTDCKLGNARNAFSCRSDPRSVMLVSAGHLSAIECHERPGHTEVTGPLLGWLRSQGSGPFVCFKRDLGPLERSKRAHSPLRRASASASRRLAAPTAASAPRVTCSLPDIARATSASGCLTSPSRTGRPASTCALPGLWSQCQPFAYPGF
jgi:hypothetical protein